MKLVIALNFVVLAIIMIGLFAIARTNHEQLGETSKYWSVAIVCDAIGLLMMGVLFITAPDLNTPNFSGTIANTLLFASTLYQAISIRALNTAIPARTARYVLVSVAIFAIVWDTTRINTSANTRIILFAVYAFVVLLWQLRELYKLDASSRQVQIIRYSVKGEIFFTVLRVIAVSAVGVEILHVQELPVLGLFSFLVLYGLKIVVYAGLVAYWSENLAKQRAKAELEKQQFKELSERQERLIADLGRLNKAAAAGVMAASIAHELSQPLQSLVLNTELIRQELSVSPQNQQLLTDTVNEQKTSVDRMVEVINTMRGMFSENAQTGRDQDVDLFQLIQRLAIFMNAQARKYGVQIEYVNTATATASIKPTEIQQVILNLVANAFDALKLVDEGPAKKIKISVQQDADSLICEIADSGQGIPEAQLENVFQFLKTTKTTGMGLGLWLSKYIVERNHGQISVGRSQLGGARFTMKFPAVMHSAMSLPSRSSTQ